MSKHQTGPKNGNWRGGKTVTEHGYVLIRVGTEHHLSDVRGYAYEHRVVAENKIGRRLRPEEQVHHIDGNKQNNSPDNLEVTENMQSHRYLHRKEYSNRRKPGEDNPIITCMCGCKTRFEKYDASGRPRKYVSGHNPIPAPQKEFVLSLLQNGPKTIDQLNSTYKNCPALKTILSKMCQDGLITRVKRGQYGKGV